MQIYEKDGCTGGADTITIVPNGGTATAFWGAAVIDNDALALDVVSTGGIKVQTGAGTARVTNTTTPTTANSLVLVFGFNDVQNNSGAAGSGYSPVTGVDVTAGRFMDFATTNLFCFAEYAEITGTGNITPGVTYATGSTTGLVALVFRENAVGAALAGGAAAAVVAAGALTVPAHFAAAANTGVAVQGALYQRPYRAARAEIAIYRASTDGLFWGRYPNGDKPSTIFASANVNAVVAGILTSGIRLSAAAAIALAATGGLTTSSVGAPNPPTSFLLVQQGGTSNATTPSTASQKHNWAAPLPGPSVTGFRLYRGKNGAAYGPGISTPLADVANTVFTFTDTTCTNSNDQTFTSFLDQYSYGLTAYNGVGESAMVRPTVYFQQNGIPNQSQGAFSFGIPPASEQWGATLAGRLCYLFNFDGGGAQPISKTPMAGQYDLNIGPDYTHFTIDVCPGATIVDTTLNIGRASRIPDAAGGDAFGWFAGANLYAPAHAYGPAPTINTWTTYLVPKAVLGMGECTATASIVNGVLHVTSLLSGPDIIAAGGRISGVGIPTGTIVRDQNQNSSIGTFVIFGAGINSGTNVASTTIKFQCYNCYKMGMARSGDNALWSIGFDNFGFVSLPP